MNPTVIPLTGQVRDYAWGSTTAIQHMLGAPVDGRPAAELWFGAHQDAPARVPTHGTTLDALIAADPAGSLGQAACDRFGGQLPFLVKVLAAERPLSIQVHPTRAQAQRGYDREDEAGVARDSPRRSYRDRNHKPELICAVTEFEALCGFRPIRQTLQLLDELALPGLRATRDLLAGPDGLRTAFAHLLTLPDAGAVVDALGASAGATQAGPFAGPLRAVRLAAAEFPGDRGVLLTLLLNYVRLEPGEALYLDAGNVHSYLRGVGVEIMANSDNVLRCGLTGKHVDVDELLAVAQFRELNHPYWSAEISDGVRRFDAPVDDFALTRVEVEGWRELPAETGPRILLCTEGSVDVSVAAGVDPSAAGAVHTVPSGHAVFVMPGTAAALAGRGLAFVASTGTAAQRPD